MALIKCPGCGREISDKAASCPGCGCPSSEFFHSVYEDNRTELDKIADDIAWWCPLQVGAVKEFQKQTGVDLRTARDMMLKRYKNGKQKSKDMNRCPKCGSGNLKYEKEDDRSMTVTYFRKVHITTHEKGKTKVKCNDCGKTWKI